MAERTSLSDGGYVEWSFEDTTTTGDPKGVLHVQKHAADGSPVGAALDVTTLASNYGVWALRGGGFTVGATQSTMDGQTLAAQIYGTDAALVTTVDAGSDWHLTSSPDGGFLVGSVHTTHHQFTAPDSTLTLYSNSGAVVSTATVATTHGPTTSVDADGVLHANWTDGGGFAHTLAFDPEHPQTYSPPQAPGALKFVDDVGTRTGVQSSGGTDDTTPAIRVPVTQTGWVAVEIAYSPEFALQPPMNPTRFLEVTAEDVARGYKEIASTAPLTDNNYGVAARFESAEGVVGPQTWIPMRVDTQAPTAPTITKAVDDSGAQQGDLASGATTDDTSPTVQVSLAGTGVQSFDSVLLFDNGKQINIASVDANALQQGYVTFATTAAAGSHSYTALINDFGGNHGATSAAFDLTVDSGANQGRTITSQQYGDTLTGGAGNDTLVAGQGPDQLTGGGGGDVFAFRQLPWNAGHVTDFAVGSDKLDLSALFSASGYAGSDPIRDHYVSLQSDGAGGSIVYYDTDGAGSGNTILYKITTLDHVSFASSWAQLSGGGGGGGTVNFSTPTVSHAEGNSGVTTFSFTVTRSGDVSQSGQTQYRIIGAGEHPADAADVQMFGGGGSGLIWNPGQTSQVLTVNVTGDTTAETDETFSVVLSTPGAGNTNPTAIGPNGTATGVIVDDDAASPPSYGTVQISPTAVSHSEGNSGITAFSYTLTRTGDVSQGATTAYKVVGTGSNPADGADFQGGALPNVTFAWNPGESSKTITVNVAGDGSAEADETFNVVLQSSAGTGSNPTAIGANNTAAGTIVNDDTAPGDGGRTINSSQYGDTLTGGTGNDTLNAGRGPDVLTGGGGGDVFAYHDLPWNAGRVTDFAVGADRVDLSALFQASGYTGSDPIADGYVSLQSDGAGGAILLYDTDGRASGNTIQFRIADLEHVSSSANWAQLTGGGSPQQVNIDLATVSHSEGQSGLTSYAFNVTRSGDTSQGGTTSYRVVGSGDHPADGSDFENGAAPNVTFAWNAGETSRVITVNVVGDTTAENDETFSVILTTPGAGNSNPTAVGPNSTATGVIVNDDGPPPPPTVPVIGFQTTNLAMNEGDSGSTPRAYIITRTGDTSGVSSVHYTVSGASTDPATGNDFVGGVMPSGTITFAAGETSKTLTIDVAGDTTFERNEGFYIDLSAPTGATIAAGAGNARGDIGNDDSAPTADGRVMTSSQYGDTLSGSDGNDTLNAGQGPDRLIGAGGADLFVFGKEPWNAGHVTDFTPGVDKLDFRQIFAHATYRGSDPVGAHVLEFRSDGAGNTQVYIDHDDPNGGDWPFLITTLDGVSPGQIGAGDWIVA